jgi:hypothetical protein
MPVPPRAIESSSQSCTVRAGHENSVLVRFVVGDYKLGNRNSLNGESSTRQIDSTIHESHFNGG